MSKSYQKEYREKMSDEQKQRYRDNQKKYRDNMTDSKWPYIPDHPYRILIIGGSGSGKTNALLNLINNQPDIDKIYLYAKDPNEKKINI